jgi:outer membrane protein assembly factor BamB
VTGEEDGWPTADGPFDGNAVCKAAGLRPPLAVAWKHPITGNPRAGLRLGRGDVVVVPNGDSALECLDLTSGEQRWTLPAGRRPEAECALVGEHVVSEVRDETSPYLVRLQLHALADGREEASFPVCLPALGTFMKDGPCLRLSDWFVRLDGLSCQPATTRRGKVLAGRIVGREIEEAGPAFFVASRDLASDSVAWRVPVEPGRSEVPLCLTDEVVVTHAETRGGQHWIRLRSSADGALRWEVPTHEPRVITWPAAVSAGLLYRWEMSRLVAQELTTGAERWTQRVAGPHSNVVVTLRHVWFAAKTRHGGFELVALHRGTGELVWSVGINAAPRGLGLALVGDSLLVAAGKTLTCWRA